MKDVKFEKKWSDLLGLPNGFCQKIVNIVDLFEWIYDEGLKLDEAHIGRFHDEYRTKRLSVFENQIYLEYLLYHEEVESMFNPVSPKEEWIKDEVFRCSVGDDGEIYVNRLEPLAFYDLYNIEQKESIFSKCSKNSNIEDLTPKQIQNALYQFLKELDPEDAFNLLDKSNSARSIELSKLSKRYSACDYEPAYVFSSTAFFEVTRELFPGANLYDLFPEHDVLHTLEVTSSFDNIEWYEKAFFGKVVECEAYGYLELPQIEVDKSNPEYQSYRQELYRLSMKYACGDENLSIYIANQMEKPEFDHLIELLDKNDLRENLNFNAALEMIENKSKLLTRKRLSSEQIKELKKLYSQGYTKTSIAEKFGISVNSVTYHVGKRKK